MMVILEPKIDKYLAGLLPERDAVVHEMEKYAETHNFPIVGPLVGRLLWQVTKMNKAKTVFEMGSGFGYSTYWLAKALPDDGKLFFTEFSDDNIKLAEEFLQKAGIRHKVDIVQGNAVAALNHAEGEYDIILNDIDKEYYPESFDVIMSHLRKGGILITDNLLWHGRVVEEEPDVQTLSIVEYSKKIYESEDLWTTIIPLRDGVGISYKLN